VDDHGHQPVTDLLPPDDHDIGGLDHRVGGRQRGHVTLGLDHPERVLCHQLFLSVMHRRRRMQLGI
jgi:hypothetical protein